MNLNVWFQKVVSLTAVTKPLSCSGEGGMKSFRWTEGDLAGISGAGPTDPGSERTLLGGGGGTTNSSGTSEPSSVMPSNTGEACSAKN